MKSKRQKKTSSIYKEYRNEMMMSKLFQYKKREYLTSNRVENLKMLKLDHAIIESFSFQFHTQFKFEEVSCFLSCPHSFNVNLFSPLTSIPFCCAAQLLIFKDPLIKSF